MIRAVIDKNTIASGATHPQGASGAIMLAWRRGSFRMVVSDHILDELSRTLEDRYFAKRLTRRERKSMLARLRRQAVLTRITHQVSGIAPHAEDDAILATALSGAADYVVTWDKAFQAIRSHDGVRVVSPPDFLEVLATVI